jgi:hypothetical protein
MNERQATAFASPITTWEDFTDNPETIEWARELQDRPSPDWRDVARAYAEL